METISIHNTKTQSSKAFWTARIINWLLVLFLLTDAIMKIMLNHYHVQGSGQLGWAVETVRPLGIVLLICTVLYIIPRTAFLGAILLTGYLGGAIATMARLAEAFYFPLVFAVLVWGVLYLRNERLRTLLPFMKP